MRRNPERKWKSSLYKEKIKPTKIKNTCLFTIFLKLAEIKIRESMKMYL